MKSLIILVGLCFVTSLALAQPIGLVPYRKGSLWGFANTEGKIVIEPQFERTFFFNSDSIARIRQNGLYGFIDVKGAVKIKPQYTAASDFYLGVSSVEKNGKKFCINLEGNEDECNPVEEEYASEEEAYTGFTIASDSLGMALIIDARRDTIKDRFDDIQIVSRYFFPKVNHFAIVRKKNLFGAYHPQGMLIAPVEYVKLDILDVDTYKAVKDKLWGANDFNGANVLPFEYDSIAKVTELLFLEDRLQKNNHFIVSKKNKLGILDSYRKNILKIEYDVIKTPKPCSCPTEYVVGKNNLVGLINFKGKFIVPMKYADIEPFQSGDITMVKTVSGQEGYINRNGREYFSN